MRSFLVTESGRLKDREIPLRGKKTLIGRSHDCDVQILDGSLSRIHFFVERKGGECHVTDLNSRNGTFLNGKRITNAILLPDQLITAGDVKLRFKQEYPSGELRDSTISVVTREAGGDEKIEKRIDLAKTVLLDVEYSDEDTAARLQRDLSTIYRMSSAIHSEHDLKRLCELVLDSIMNVVGGERGFLLLRDDTGAIQPAVVRTPYTEEGTEVALSSSILNEVMERGMAVLSSDAQLDDRFKEGDSIIMHNITSAMCVPVGAEDDVAGAIYVDTSGISNTFKEEDLELLGAIAEQAGLAIDRARLIQDLEDLFYDSVRTLVATIEASDAYTRGHSERVTALAVETVRTMDADEGMIDKVRLAGLLHDIGKIGIPTSVLNKKDPLTDEEWGRIKTHPAVGFKIISNIRRIEEDVAVAVKHHHERWDGTGYPEGLSGSDIPIISRVLSVADAYDAMTSMRPYRERAFFPEESVKELHDKAGQQFDREIVEAFLRAYPGGVVIPSGLTEEGEIL